MSSEKPQEKPPAFVRPPSAYRSFISSKPGSKYPPEKDRYVLYVNYACPWASRANLVYKLKGLEDVIQLATLDWELSPQGWSFTGRDGTDAKDPNYGFTKLAELYEKFNPDHVGRWTVPTLWDKKTESIVSNESSEVIRMLYAEFDEFLPPDQREENKPGGGFLPENLKAEIDQVNSWIYDNINNGVYKAGFAPTQEAYEAAVTNIFASLDRVEDILAKSDGPYLFGKHITEADIRLYPTIARFDTCYHTLFMCNLYMIREHYPNIEKWFETLYWDEGVTRGAFRRSTKFSHFKQSYSLAAPRTKFVPLGPAINIPQKK